MVEFKDFKDIINLIIFIIIVAIVSFAFPLMALTIGRGGEAQQNIELFQIMGVWGLIGIIVFGALKVGELITSRFKSNKKIYAKIGWIGTVLHDPEKGVLPSIKKGGFGDEDKETFFLFKWIESPFKLLAVSIPFFAVISLFLLFRKSLLTALPTLTFQQISKFAEGILAVEPSGLEIFLPLAFLGFVIHFAHYLEDTEKIPKGFKWAIIFLVPFLYGLLWMGMHRLIHPDSDIALGFVYIFGVISAYLVVLTGSIIPAWVFKDMNNLFSYLEGVLKSNEEVLALTIISIVIYTIIVSIIWFISSRIKKRFTSKEEE